MGLTITDINIKLSYETNTRRTNRKNEKNI